MQLVIIVRMRSVHCKLFFCEFTTVCCARVSSSIALAGWMGVPLTQARVTTAFLGCLPRLWAPYNSVDDHTVSPTILATIPLFLLLQMLALTRNWTVFWLSQRSRKGNRGNKEWNGQSDSRIWQLSMCCKFYCYHAQPTDSSSHQASSL